MPSLKRKGGSHTYDFFGNETNLFIVESSHNGSNGDTLNDKSWEEWEKVVNECIKDDD